MSELKLLWTYPCCFLAKDHPSPFLAHVQLKPHRTRLDEFVKDADPWKLQAILHSNVLREMSLLPLFTGISDRAETQESLVSRTANRKLRGVRIVGANTEADTGA